MNIGADENNICVVKNVYRRFSASTNHKAEHLILIISILIIITQGCCSITEQTMKTPTAHSAVEPEVLSRQIVQLVSELEYPDTVAENFAEMVIGWEDQHKKPVLAVWQETLNQAKENYRQGNISEKQLAKTEADITKKLCRKIQKEIRHNDKFFDLADVIKYKQAQCLGYSQLFYILASEVGLSVTPINVAAFQTADPLPVGFVHIACMVNLIDNSTIMLDLTPPSFISEPFKIENYFTKTGGYRTLNNTDNFLNIHRKIQFLNENGLAAHIYNSRGALSASMGRLEQALANYNRAVELNPDSAEVYNNRGIAHRLMGQSNEALADYDRAIELNPNFAEAFNNRGTAYGALKQFDRAVSDYNHALELNPNFAQAYYNRGIMHDKSGLLKDAISDYDSAIALKPNFIEAYSNRGVSYAMSGKQKAAGKDLLKVVKLSPDSKAHVKTIADRLRLNISID
jgi:tetratricopeptide (TPR) repeat protein